MGEASGAGRRPELPGEGGGEGAVACSSSAPGPGRSPASHLPSPAAAALSSPHSTARSGFRAGKAPSEVRAEPPARLEITPRPPGAPPPAWAPPRGGGSGGGWAGGDHSSDLRVSPGSSRAPRPRALCGSRGRLHGPRASKEPPLGAVQRPRGWGRWCWEPRPSPGVPDSRPHGCHLAPERGQSAATAWVGRTPAPTWGDD